MELIIAVILFTILVACWIILPADNAPVPASAEAAPSSSAQRTI